MRVKTHPDVYEPAEDSQLLVSVLEGLGPLAGARTLDVGTGTGIAALTLARAGARVLAVDLNPHAVTLARQNAREAGLAARVDVVRGDLLSMLAPGVAFDVVTFNAPYLPSTPEERVEGWLDHAFHGGDAGVEVAERFLRQIGSHLSAAGRAYLVLSSTGDVARALATAEAAGLAWEKLAARRFFFEEVAVYAFVQR